MLSRAARDHRPASSVEDEALAPHRLYGVRAAAEPANAAWWREAALGEIGGVRGADFVRRHGHVFLRAVNGIAEIPDPGAEARAQARDWLAELGAPALHARLDAETAAKLKPNDSQRIARAYEVLLGTGQGPCASGSSSRWKN